MDFTLPAHVEALRDEVRKFAEREIRPHVMVWDEAKTFPMDVVRKLGEMGMLGVIFPEAYGGAGMGYLEYAVVVEELSRVDGSVGITVAAHNSLCSNHIFAMGNEAQKQKFLRPLASGQVLGAWGLTEPGSGSDAGSLRTTGRKEGSHWVLNGTKTFITHARVGEIFVVMARTRPPQKGKGSTDGISAFVLEKGMNGLRAGKQENKLGLRASDTSELILEDVKVSEENMLGEEGVGFKQAMKTLDGGRISNGALGLGMAQGAFEEAIRYAKVRQAFGKPIAEHQGVQFKLADMGTQVEAARLLVYRAANLKDQGQPYAKAASMAKLFSSEVACRVAEEAVQILGGYGYVKDYPVEKYYRDVKLCTIGEGTSEIQRTVIARHLMLEY
ncbi:MAG: acyl-CoA dehydrogenase family protein [Acidobacteria bacterium]|nr:acyl-CoA dehydrogenase family protein [Acidobacteriota bacterium]